ncbi:MAG: winged helix-turn-helix transcriptional regulator [Spirochaetes bacterium]|nr:winged helix-turn-helix transcriptional regulator [Spirochaetota bacterium]
MPSQAIAVCKTQAIHKDMVTRAQKNMPSEEIIRKAGDFFKTLGDPTRIKIINALLHEELCVCDIAAVLNMNQTTISHQLKTLKAADMVKYRKEGKIVYYSLDDEHITEIYQLGMVHIKEESGV